MDTVPICWLGGDINFCFFRPFVNKFKLTSFVRFISNSAKLVSLFCSTPLILTAGVPSYSATCFSLPPYCTLPCLVDHIFNGSREDLVRWHCLTLFFFLRPKFLSLFDDVVVIQSACALACAEAQWFPGLVIWERVEKLC